MQFKVAVGSRDGKVVNEHFGSCSRFLIFIADPEQHQYRFESFLPVTPPCSAREHSDSGLLEAAETLSECRIVLVSRIGPPAELALTRQGIDVLEYHGLIEDAMKRILQYYR